MYDLEATITVRGGSLDGIVQELQKLGTGSSTGTGTGSPSSSGFAGGQGTGGVLTPIDRTQPAGFGTGVSSQGLLQPIDTLRQRDLSGGKIPLGPGPAPGPGPGPGPGPSPGVSVAPGTTSPGNPSGSVADQLTFVEANWAKLSDRVRGRIVGLIQGQPQ